jgi:hypothetical protein
MAPCTLTRKWEPAMRISGQLGMEFLTREAAVTESIAFAEVPCHKRDKQSKARYSLPICVSGSAQGAAV